MSHTVPMHAQHERSNAQRTSALPSWRRSLWFFVCTAISWPFRYSLAASLHEKLQDDVQANLQGDKVFGSVVKG